MSLHSYTDEVGKMYAADLISDSDDGLSEEDNKDLEKEGEDFSDDEEDEDEADDDDDEDEDLE